MYKIRITPEEIEKMPQVSFSGDIVVVDSLGTKFLSAIAYLYCQKVIGFDTETRPCFSPGQHHNGVALLQLSGGNKAFLFRVNKIGMHKLLCKILASKKIIKVGAATNDDVRGLQKLGGFEAHNFVDLQRMVSEYGIYDKSVKKMGAIILGVKISKAQQLSNWEAASLSESQQKYAATDAWICREMYLKLLKSEKNPLTAEQIAQFQQQPQPAQLPAAGEVSEAGEQPAAKKRRRRRKPASKPAVEGEQQNQQPKQPGEQKPRQPRQAAPKKPQSPKQTEGPQAQSEGANAEKPAQKKPKAPKKPQAPKPAEGAPADQQAPKKSSSHRRYYHHKPKAASQTASAPKE